MAVLDPSLEQRVRDSRLRKDPLALVPLASVVALPIAYIYASGYELGRADRFGIPRSMVSVDLRSSLVPFIWLLFMIFCTVPFLYQVQQRGFPATGLVIAKRLRGLFFLIEAVAAFSLILQRQFTLGFGLTALGGLYVILYGIPALLGRLYTMLRRPVRRRYLNRRIRQMLSALRQHIFGEPWARQSLRFQVAYGTFVLVMGIILLPYGIGNVAAVINQKYSVLGSVNNQGNAEAIVGTYGDKVFIADVRRGVAQAVIVKNLDDVKDIEVGEAEFPGLALDLCRREPDQLSQILCLVAG